MELRKELPEVFEEFAEARKNSFLAIKKIKDAGTPIVGVFCTYLPREIANAMGAAVVGLCSVSDETIPDAEKDLPRNLCPLIKSSYGFARTDKCPFFYFSDLVVGETTCDGKKKMYEMLAEDLRDGSDCRTQGVLCLTQEEAESVWSALKEKGIEADLLTKDSMKFRTGISVMPFYLAKGLEFDAVYIPDAQKYQTPLEKQAMYINVTRALHKLKTYILLT